MSRQPKRRIKRLKVDLVTLCPKGKNQMPAVYKASDGLVGVEYEVLAKACKTRGELTCVVYAPNVIDSDGDFVDDPEVIKAAMYEASQRGTGIDVQHDGRPVGKDRAFTAERFIVQKGDPRFSDFRLYDGTPHDPVGAWAEVIKLVDPELRKAYEEERWQGVSLFGGALVEPVRLGKEEVPMPLTKEDIDAIGGVLSKALEPLIKSLPKAVEPKAPEQTKTPEQSVAVEFDPAVFKGNPLNAADVQGHLEKVAAAELRKSVDWKDAGAVGEYLEKLKKARPESTGGSTQPISSAPAGSNIPAVLTAVGLSKSEADAAVAGAAAGAILNKVYARKA